MLDAVTASPAHPRHRRARGRHGVRRARRLLHARRPACRRPTRTARPAACARTRNYPSLLAAGLAIGVVHRRERASGASTTSLTGVERRVDDIVVPPQFDAVDARTALVTIGIGGQRPQHVPAPCSGPASSSPLATRPGSPCRDQYDRRRTDAAARQRSGQIGGLRTRRSAGIRDAGAGRAGGAGRLPAARAGERHLRRRCPLAAGDYDVRPRRHRRARRRATRGRRRGRGATTSTCWARARATTSARATTAWVEGVKTDSDRRWRCTRSRTSSRPSPTWSPRRV